MEWGEKRRIIFFQKKFNMLKYNVGFLSLNPKISRYQQEDDGEWLLPLEKVYSKSSARNEFESIESNSAGIGRFRVLFSNVLISLWKDVNEHKELSILSVSRGLLQEAGTVLGQSQEVLLYGQVILYSV